MSPDQQPRKEPRQDAGKVYDEEAKNWDKKSGGLLTFNYIVRPTLEENIAKYVKNLSKAKVLDIGSGTGRIFDVLEDHGVLQKNITGVEISKKEVEILRKKKPKATAILGHISKTELPKEKFNLATFIMVSEFLDNEDLGAALTNIFESMKKGGVLELTSTHSGRAIGKFDDVTEDYEGWYKTGHPWGGKFKNFQRSEAKLAKLIKSAGFEIKTEQELQMPESVQEEHPEYKTFEAPARINIVAVKPE